MSAEQSRSRMALWKEAMNVEDRYSKSMMKNRNSLELEYCSRSFFSKDKEGKLWRYFTAESLVVLVCLTVALLILPVVLPPLPPPPFAVVLLPICIMGLLMLLAFMPSNARHAIYTNTYN